MNSLLSFLLKSSVLRYFFMCKFLDFKGLKFVGLLLIHAPNLVFYYFKSFFLVFLFVWLSSFWLTYFNIFIFRFLRAYMFFRSFFSFNFLRKFYLYSYPDKFYFVEFLKNVSLLLYNFASYLINGTIFSFFFVFSVFFLFFEAFLVFTWSVLFYLKLYFQVLYFRVSYYLFSISFSTYYLFYLLCIFFLYALAFLLFFSISFWFFNLDFISPYVNFEYYSGRVLQSFNTFAHIKGLPMVHHISLWWLFRVYLLYFFLFFVNGTIRSYILQHTMLIFLLPILISATSYRSFLVYWLNYFGDSVRFAGHAEKRLLMTYGPNSRSQWNEIFRGSDVSNPDQEFIRPYVRPFLRSSDTLRFAEINDVFRVTDGRTGSDRRRFHDISHASEIDSYKYDQMRMERLKAAVFYLEEGGFQEELKNRVHDYQYDPREACPETGDRDIMDPAIFLQGELFTGPLTPAPVAYERAEPRLPPEITPIIEFEDISFRDSEDDIARTFIPMANEERREWWEAKKPTLVSNEPVLYRSKRPKSFLNEFFKSEMAWNQDIKNEETKIEEVKDLSSSGGSVDEPTSTGSESGNIAKSKSSKE